MDFAVSDEQRMLVDSSRKFLARESPINRVRELADSDERGYDERVWQSGAELGWAGLLIAEQYDGLGRDLVDVALIAEEHGRTVQPGPLIGNTLAAVAISQSGRDDLCSEILPLLAGGQAVAAWAFAESRQPWDADGVCTVATEHADGFRLQGIKTVVQNADSASWILVAAHLGGRLAQFLVDRRAAGLAVRRLRTLDITRRFDEVALDDVVVAPSALLHAGEAAEAALAHQNRCGAVLISADNIGVGEAVLDMTVKYAKLRVQFGRPIGSFQAVKHKCATMRMWLQASKAATYYAAMAVAADADDAEEAASVAKAYTSSAIAALTSEALQVHGGIGFTWEHDLHLYHRRAKANQVLFGDQYLHHERLAAALETATA
ncbi:MULTISPECIES: acyl-CoA dehydrogenase family protein [Mycobacterium avium complex (MAC)]|uniref:Acyl-CoA dehydrogenase n=2 Tax=Mycobacterium TaxID=1763 RepID=A0A1X1Z700_9MYCO|nr:MULTISPECIES: acyl-CoA dehydrogenase family protein [Mycobacterium avium complex (MAC)]KLO39458.1 acyl-CoA dehydrogenase [Mycobacterium nebraskense]MBZ4517979.1 acyl-CoA dehydrogenase [Mycobacterium avium subsp. hominissuis]MBZ4527783.1 acyl-CoA dehydrogenase [Mycobacterium avium subsp. hominissuis]MBZ4547154.1 acyl-CoA dehydrogenase [Mycobacterium avium subsp. hominissuis]MBZ4556776.1 acyl-CoA dehydrogenase [Mycobacterium avium subsp. hominissuis]